MGSAGGAQGSWHRWALIWIRRHGNEIELRQIWATWSAKMSSIARTTFGPTAVRLGAWGPGQADYDMRKSKSFIRLERLEYPNLALRMTSLWLPCGCVSEFYAQEIWRDLWSTDRCSGHLLTRSPRSASIQHQPHGLHGIVMPWVALSWRRSHAQPASDAFAQPQAITEGYCYMLFAIGQPEYQVITRNIKQLFGVQFCFRSLIFYIMYSCGRSW